MNDEIENRYISVIGSRYRGYELEEIWSTNNKIKEMRLLWINLAKYQKELGIEEITNIGISEMENNYLKIDINKINDYEKTLKHDIMAHIYAFGDLCPNAKKFIHYGATSNFINDNVDIILIKRSFEILMKKTENLISLLNELILEYKSHPTIAYTHLQKGQLTTIGKRFCMWNSDIIDEYKKWKREYEDLKMRGMKGTVGSEDTLLKIFEGDHNRCKKLNELLKNEYGFKETLIICGQTYSRKIDVNIIHLLSGLSQTIYKIMNDIRLLQSKYELNEKFGTHQIGSSAMPYKMNPINCERICSLCRYIFNQESSFVQTYTQQWLERSLDDSAIKRILYPECFILMENIIESTIKVFKNLQINEEIINKSVDEQMPYIISEEIIIKGVKMGYDRQELHEKIRKILIEYTNNLMLGKEKIELNELEIKRLFSKDEDLKNIFDTNYISINPRDYIGRCVEQINEYISSISYL